MFSLFNDLLTSAAVVVNDISDQGIEMFHKAGILDALESVSDNPNSTAAAALSNEQTLSLTDIMTPPTAWAGSQEEWVWCVKAALCDPNTCALTPTILRSDASLWEEIKTTVAQLFAAPPQPGKMESPVPTETEIGSEASANVASELLERAGSKLTPTADLVKYVQENYKVYRVRSDVVPRFTSDEDYWLNMKWRTDLYQQCINAEQLLTLMQVLSRLPKPLRDMAAPANRKTKAEKNEYGNVQHEGGNDGDDEDNREDGQRVILRDNTNYWRDMRREHEAIQEKFAWIRETEKLVKKEIQLASSNVKLLGNLLQRQEASTTLGASVFDSCQYHKVRLSRLIADVCAAPTEHTEGTSLDSKTGALFQALAQCNDDVRAVLEAFVNRPPGDFENTDGVVSSPSLPTQSAEPSLPVTDEVPSRKTTIADTTTSATQKVGYARESSPVKLSASAREGSLRPDSIADDSGESSFEAKLPWSMSDSES
ncbi:hypothetical protein JKF63_03077 [Porcisia hertigi]|uniref:BSD domain-containing protein n=1 Tax=Porcisia hertigi TaxID=2761500 RepID=A0A836LFY7_9TRYP|nr:hypothetical protein JKF63_03077 [Porcisia hertigi]